MTTAVVAIGGLYMGIRKLRLTWGADQVTMASQDAQQSLVTQLHDELTRLAGQNALLASELNKLQLHILDLTKQITRLTVENQQFVAKISDLSAEVQAFRAAIPAEIVTVKKVEATTTTTTSAAPA